VYVVGGAWKRGGTRVALRVGEILAEHFGFTLRIVQGRNEAAPGLVTIDDVRRHSTAEDVVICNPSFSDHQLGLTSAARVVMYVQSVNAYRAIDGFCDLYVASSAFVRDHLALHYGMAPNVISPFVDLAAMPDPPRYVDRAPASALVYTKVYGEALLEALRERLLVRSLAFELVLPAPMDHAAYLRALGSHRFSLSLGPLHGFGLVPLESLALGTVPLGFHGQGALDYLDEVTGAGLTHYPDLDGVVARLERLVADPEAAATISAAGPDVAARYGPEVFERRWVDELAARLGESPDASV
jgi:hypothetical protein